MSKFYNNEDIMMLKNYFKDINNMDIELLTPEEEVDLAIRIQNGDNKALYTLVEANLKFVVRIANEYNFKGANLSDLVSEGNYGLVKAAKKFDHTRGFRFISYAVHWIRQSILQYLNEHARTIRIPVNILNKVYQLQKELNNGSDTELSQEDKEYIEKLPKCSSLNFQVNEDGDEVSDLVAEEPYSDFNNLRDEDLLLKKQITECMDILDERERNILVKYYGLFEHEPLTLEVIGEEYDLTKERVRQIKSKAIKKLKYNLISIIKNKY
jgi:RNA polymerase primary sigma factor